jgi:ketosteroid isomerase-like protein
MKKSLLLPGVLLILLSCTRQPPTPVEEVKKSNVDENIALVKKYMAAYEAEDIETMKSLSGDSLLIMGPGNMDELNFKEYYEEWVPGIFEKEDSRHYNVITMTQFTTQQEGIAGDWVLCWADFSYFDLATRKTIIFPLHFASLVRDGKIQIIVRYYDQLDIYNQLGYQLKPVKE